PAHRDPLSFPTRRSSDLYNFPVCKFSNIICPPGQTREYRLFPAALGGESTGITYIISYHRMSLVIKRSDHDPSFFSIGENVIVLDRKSTRLNSSHVKISY